jgi:predicted GIY-YIG superfamily endonuclease
MENNMYLYVIEANNNGQILYKIGITNDLDKRIKNIRTGNPYPVQYVFNQEIEQASKIERWLHIQFNKYRMEGEWFHTITLNDIRKKIFIYNEFDV